MSDAQRSVMYRKYLEELVALLLNLDLETVRNWTPEHIRAEIEKAQRG